MSEREYVYTEMEFWVVGMCLFLLGLVFMWTIWGINSPSHSEIDLGQAICEKQFQRDFDYYDLDEKRLYCKPMPEVKKYDGITVNIGGD